MFYFGLSMCFTVSVRFCFFTAYVNFLKDDIGKYAKSSLQAAFLNIEVASVSFIYHVSCFVSIKSSSVNGLTLLIKLRKITSIEKALYRSRLNKA